MRHYNEQTEAWEPTKLVAVLSSEDAPDWGSNLAGDFAYMTARVSPDGNYLAFMSDRSLTGYDNEDASSKKPGERMDEEVFLYHTPSEGEAAGEGEVRAKASCAYRATPAGRARPVCSTRGMSLGGSGEGLGLVVDRPEVWSAHTDVKLGKRPAVGMTGSPGASPGGRHSLARTLPTSLATCPTAGGCSSTAPMRSCR